MASTINPWLGLPLAAPYVLPCDQSAIETFNSKLPAGNHFRIEVETVIPEPFIGAITTASVVVLQLNPGFNPATDPFSHADAQFRASLLANLRHEGSNWPFYFFDPRFMETHAGGVWWKGKIKQLVQVIPLELLAQRFAVVEWFPYKSSHFKEGCRVESQDYGFSRVRCHRARGTHRSVTKCRVVGGIHPSTSDLLAQINIVVSAECCDYEKQPKVQRRENK